MKLNSWRGIGLDGDVLLTPYVPEGITGYDDNDDKFRDRMKAEFVSMRLIVLLFKSHWNS